MSIVIRNVSPYAEGAVDLVVKHGVIIEIAPVGTGVANVVYDFNGEIVLPGLVDLHTHLREPGREDAETIRTGTMAAASRRFHSSARNGQH